MTTNEGKRRIDVDGGIAIAGGHGLLQQANRACGITGTRVMARMEMQTRRLRRLLVAFVGLERA